MILIFNFSNFFLYLNHCYLIALVDIFLHRYIFFLIPYPHFFAGLKRPCPSFMCYDPSFCYPCIIHTHTHIHTHRVVAISWGTEQQQIFKWFLLEKICMCVYEIFPKYTWNKYVFITYKVFKDFLFFYSKLIVN